MKWKGNNGVDLSAGELSVDVIGVIFSFLDFKTICNCCNVNKLFNQIGNDDLLWEKLFKFHDFILDDIVPSSSNIKSQFWKQKFKLVIEGTRLLPPNHSNIKVVIVGDGAVGKSVETQFFLFCLNRICLSSFFYCDVLTFIFLFLLQPVFSLRIVADPFLEIIFQLFLKIISACLKRMEERLSYSLGILLDKRIMID